VQEVIAACRERFSVTIEEACRHRRRRAFQAAKGAHRLIRFLAGLAALMAVYTEVSNARSKPSSRSTTSAARLLQRHRRGGGEQQLRSLDRPRSYILTLYEKRVARADLPFFLGPHGHLAAKGIVCPTPLHQRSGSASRTVRAAAAIISFLDGHVAAPSDPRQCHAAGRGHGGACIWRAQTTRARARQQPVGRGLRRLHEATAGARA